VHSVLARGLHVEDLARRLLTVSSLTQLNIRSGTEIAYIRFSGWVQTDPLVGPSPRVPWYTCQIRHDRSDMQAPDQAPGRATFVPSYLWP
jgi:hypothetical protein